MKAIILDTLDPSSDLYRDWEKLVVASTTSGVMQSLPWAEFKRRQGLQTLHIGVFDEHLIAGAIFYIAPRYHGSGLLVAPEGPVLPWDDGPVATEALRLIKDEAQKYAQNFRLLGMRIEPRLAQPLPKLLREFGRAPLDLVPKETLYLDLRLSQEQLLASMKPKGRYNIKLAQRRGLKIVEKCGADAVGQFYECISEASKRDGFALEPRSFFDYLADTLCPTGVARFLFAEHEGELLGALLLITYGQRGTYLYGGITNHKRNLMGGYALQWAAIEAAQAAGCKTYDFYGFNEFCAPGHPYSRFSQFKRQFGGAVNRFVGAHDCFFIDCLADAFIKAVNESDPKATGQHLEDFADRYGTENSALVCYNSDSKR